MNFQRKLCCSQVTYAPVSRRKPGPQKTSVSGLEEREKMHWASNNRVGTGGEKMKKIKFFNKMEKKPKGKSTHPIPVVRRAQDPLSISFVTKDNFIYRFTNINRAINIIEILLKEELQKRA